MEEVILVNEYDQEVGRMEKIQAHEEAKLHRAFSVFVFNENNDLILQKRASTKYHSPSLWTNTCCSHPKPDERTDFAAHRRLIEELGFNCFMYKAFEFTYKAVFENGLTEYEYDHVYIGFYDGHIMPNPREVDEIKYISKLELMEDLLDNPQNYTEWFKICIKKVYEHWPVKVTNLAS